MKFSWNWLNEFVPINQIPLSKIISILTLCGCEIENIEEKPEIQDKIIDLNFAANRSDVLSIIGLAREISTLLNIPFHGYTYNQNISEPYFNIDSIKKHKINLTSDNLSNILFNIITIDKKQETPLWLKNYLLAYNITNNDILSNIIEYINIKWGQDIEIFDLSFSEKNTYHELHIQIETAHKFLPSFLDIIIDTQHNILSSFELLKYDNYLLSILGIGSNKRFTYHKDTSQILLIGYICKRQYINKHISYKTEKINRHIKNLSYEDLYYAYRETITLIQQYTECVIGLIYYYDTKNIINTKTIKVTKDTIYNILGPDNYFNQHYISDNTIQTILKQLNFENIYNQNIFEIKIPRYRQLEITREIDVVEEIARIHGFNRFMDTIPINHRMTRGKTSLIFELTSKIRRILRNLGLHEVVHYSLENISKEINNHIVLYNPLLIEQSQLKACLVKQLLKTALYNQKQKNLPLECFEIGKIFYLLENSEYKEELHIAGIIGNPHFCRKSWSEKPQQLTWFQAKGLVEEFFERLYISIAWLPEKQNSNIYQLYKDMCHPYRTAILYNVVTKEKIGIFSQLKARMNYDLQNSYNTYFFEFNIYNMMKGFNYKKNLNFNIKPYFTYPSVTRDISLRLSKNQSAQTIKNKILNKENSLIKSVTVFNEYYKNTINRYVGFRITYRSQSRTLNDNDLQNINDDIRNFIQTILIE